MRILNFGSANLDYVYRLDHIVVEGETEQSEEMNIFAGGKGLNQSVAVAKAGARVYHAGCIGSDGQILVDILKESGVDISLINYSDKKNGHAVIQVSKNGENSIFLYPGTNAMIGREYIDAVLGSFDKDDVLILQNEINNIQYIIDVAHEKGMFIILNPSPVNDDILEIDFNKISCLVVNETEAKAVFGDVVEQHIKETVKEKYPNMKIMLTRGGKGSCFIDGDMIYKQSAYKVKAVDTTAAGDTFMGYFVAGLSNGDKIEDILQCASAAAAIAVSRNGAAPSIPYISEVKENINLLRCKGERDKLP